MLVCVCGCVCVHVCARGRVHVRVCLCMQNRLATKLELGAVCTCLAKKRRVSDVRMYVRARVLVCVCFHASALKNRKRSGAI